MNPFWPQSACEINVLDFFDKKISQNEKLCWTRRFFCSIRLYVYRQKDAQVAQLVEQRTENPRVGGSIPSLSTISFKCLLWALFLCSANQTSLCSSSWGRASLWNLISLRAFQPSLNKVFKDVADKNNRYFGCFCLAIPIPTISFKCLLWALFLCSSLKLGALI